MVTSRVALGSVSTLALAGLLLGVAPRLLSPTWHGGSASPWGALASVSGRLSTDSPIDGNRSQVLQIAALKSSQNGSATADPAMAAAAQLSAAPASPGPTASVVPTPDRSAGEAPQDLAEAVAAPAERAAPVPVEPPVLVTSVESEANDGTALVTQSAPPSARGGSALVNINKASADVLDRFPGAGHIGHAIVSHRPYRSVADLVKKRVLTNADFRKIQGRISVD